MVVIRLARKGRKKRPSYQIVVADRRFPRDGRFIERLGYFNPMAQGQSDTLIIKKERLDYWIQQGAQSSNRVINLVKQYTQLQSENPISPTAETTPKQKPKQEQHTQTSPSTPKQTASSIKEETQPKDQETDTDQ